ncbi:MAG: hydrolase [Bacteroidetes bacterium QS_8_68_15]|jgi:beta-phosphoglucomutase|nr:MAG: hydrolase [Bacteroidetes bacterium QS_8_68_15]
MPEHDSLTDDLEAVIFDLDGVLIDSEPLHEEAKRRVFDHFGITVPEAVYDEFKGRTDAEVLEHVADHHTDDDVSAQDLIERKREEFWNLLDGLVPMDGAEAFVETAAARYRVGLCTSASQHTRELAFDPLGWEEHFETFVTAEDVARSKPDPEPYRLTAEKLGVTPERCLVVEDSLSGVRSARAAGCRVAALTTSMPEEPLREAGAHVVADRFAALAERLGNGWRETA